MYISFCTWLCSTTTRVHDKKISKKKKLWRSLKHYCKSKPRHKTTHWIRAKTKQGSTGLTHSRLDSLAKSPILLFRIKHPCNLGSMVTKLLLTLQTISFTREQKGNKKKVLNYPIIDYWSNLDLLPFLFSPKLPGMHLLHVQRENSPSTFLYMYIC